MTSSPVTASVKKRLDIKQCEILLLTPVHPLRKAAETMMQWVFARQYQAHLSHFYPYLLAVRDKSAAADEFVAVIGIRPAGSFPLFLEHYLDQPVEQRIATSRSKIVEMGNLAPAHLGQTRWLIGIITGFLYGAGFQKVVFTGVALIANAFSRMGMVLEELAEATLDALPESEQQNWGRYYASSPRVFSGYIPYGYKMLNALTPLDSPERLDWKNAQQQGRRYSLILHGGL